MMNIMFYNTEKNNHGLPHDPFKALVVPRPIAWVTSIDKKGNINLAPFSFYNAICGRPPMIMFSTEADRIRGGRKDTEKNIAETGEFVINIPTKKLSNQMNLTASSVDCNEMTLAQLESAPSTYITPPRVKKSPVQLECKLLQITKLPSENDPLHVSVIFGKVIGIHISDDALTEGLIDYKKLDAISRLGGSDYSHLTEDTVFSMPKPGTS